MRTITKFTATTAGVLLFFFLMSLSLTAVAAQFEIQTEGDCVKSSKGHACSIQVSKKKTAKFTQTVFCGDSYVYTDKQGEEFMNAHIDDEHDLVLVKDGKYFDGHCQ